jgi:hypothetical protein
VSRTACIALLAVLAACHREAPPPGAADLLVPRRTMTSLPSSPDAEDWDADDTGGLGAIDTRDAAGDPGRLRLDRVLVRARQVGDLADVAVEHRFVSDAEVQLEGTFRFPLPEGAIVTGLSMVVGGQTIEGELVDNARAREIYQEVVDSMRDPVLMEWEHGTTFKMRVFPIEPHADKVVTLRYLAPLRARGTALRFVQGTRAVAAGDAAPIAELSVQWNGERAFSAKQVTRGRIVELAAAAAPAVMSEVRPDGTYSAVRVRPDWSKVPAAATPPPRRWVVVVDTSRSALEERKLSIEALRALLSGLGEDASFVVATADLETRFDPAGFGPASAAHVAAAVRFVEATEPDGATDLGRMLRAAAAAARGITPTGVVYLGDCEPSWGEVDPAKLTAIATEALSGVPFYPLLLGDSVDPELARALAAATPGRLLRAQKAQDLARVSRVLHRSGRRLTRAILQPIEGVTLLPEGPTTLDEGEELLALVRVPAGTPAPSTLTLRGEASGRPSTTVVKLDGTPTPLVARRFGAGLVRQLERSGRPKAEIVAASTEFTVMSKHTSFLVLDSEEAYQRFAIERRAKRANAELAANAVPQPDGLEASISADRIQPGDPEIEIDAPRDAEHVFVVLPNGDSRVAAWDDEARGGRGAWMVRFLVDSGTPEGTYQARVYIEHKDGRTEARTVSYVVDTSAPRLDVRVRRAGGGYTIDVKQLAPAGQIDTRRVEVLTPDGQVLMLTALRWGVFHGRWQPTRAVAGQRLHVVGIDQALNHTTVDVVIP